MIHHTAWPQVSPHPTTGHLEVSFDAPLNKEQRVDWLRARDWLVASFDISFTSAREYPTFEWHATFTTRDGAVIAQLAWSDFPDELLVRSDSEAGDRFIEAIAQRLRTERPDLGELSTMSGKEWRRWMVSLGSQDYPS